MPCCVDGPRNGSCLDYLGLVCVGLPMFCLVLLMTVVTYLPCFILNLLVRVLTFSCSLRRDTLMLMLPFYMFWHAVLTKNNPCVPFFVGFWVQRCFFAVMDPIMLHMGRCCVCCKARTNTTYSEMNPPVVVAEDAEAGLKVTVLTALFREGLETPTQCTMIRYDDFLLFYNPVHIRPEVYKKFADEGVKRVQIVLGNKFHHMATDMLLEAFPDAQVTGSQAASRRHPSIVQRFVAPKDAWQLPGCELLDLNVPLYHECWVFFKPLGMLTVCDTLPRLLKGTSEKFSLFHKCLIAISEFGDIGCGCANGTTAVFYTVTTAQDRPFLRKVVSDLLARGDELKTIVGAHPTPYGPTFNRDQFKSTWAWLVPDKA